ncbi:uncharacterized protein LOC126565218 [Anopheles maculipalpis]|uniref:uncharacterized protein LOC126565218 n=1 Tax=Anopheles maculipalpis TaxID=1496333 RepID=UPI0021595007|nr:uncharacterized protein LOC126565218 [Anopheles maculipalpis]
MVLNRCTFVITIALHVVIIILAIFQLLLYEKFCSRMLEHEDGLLISGGSIPTKELWVLCLRLLQLVDVQSIVLHASSIIVSCRLYNDPYSRHLNVISHSWSNFTMSSLLMNLCAMVFFLKFAKITFNAVQNTLYGGLEMYQFDAIWNEFWNHLQSRNRCCGVANPSDWQGMLWRTADQEAQFERLLLPDGAPSTVVLAPISCCRNHHQCKGERINLGIGELLRSDALDALSHINHAGCFDVMRSNLASTVQMISWLDVILCSLQLGAVFCTRLLFMANRNFQPTTNI